MPQRSYTVYLQGGGHFTVRASRYEHTDEALTFFDGDGKPLPELFVDVAAVIAIVPSMSPREGAFPAVR